MFRILLFSVFFPMLLVGQTVSENPICYGKPIVLEASFLTGGAAGPSSTFQWENFSGSWESNERNPIILPKDTNYFPNSGYASDRFYLSVQYAPPQGGFSGGRVTVVIRAKHNVTPVITPAACEGTSNGSINLAVSGGSPPFSYYWRDGATTKDRINVAPGTYILDSIVDDKGCKAFTWFTCETGLTITPQSYTVGTISNFNVTTETQSALCEEYCNGWARVNPSGGSPPYTYLWSNGQTSQQINNLCSGEYSVTATDATACTIIKTATVATNYTPFDVIVKKIDLKCSIDNNGAIYLNPDRYGVYTYLWEDGYTNRIRQNLTAGDYSITITDSCGEVVEKVVTILE